jgi:hypothetical protein
MVQLEKSFVDEYLKVKKEYDSIVRAIKVAKGYEVEETKVQKLVELKMPIKKRFKDLNDTLVRLIPKSTNVAEIGDGWYAVRYLNENKVLYARVDMLLPREVQYLERDTRTARDYSRYELETLALAYIDEPSVALYLSSINKSSATLLYDYCGIVVEVGEDNAQKGENGVLRVSTHAGKRWVQRKLNISSESDAEIYQNNHFHEVNRLVLDAFKNAELIWQGRDGVKFYFDAENMMYVVDNSTIVTAYEENFGFTPDINRYIVFKQLEVLKSSMESLVESENGYDKRLSELNSELDDISGEIETYQAKIDLLLAKKQHLVSSRECCTKELRMKRQEFSLEFNKLFKKWEG